MPASRNRWALIAAIVTWVPIVLLVVVQAGSIHAPVVLEFWQAFGVHARNLICVPLLILAVDISMPRLWRIVDLFAAGDLVANRERYDAAVAHARQSFDSRLARLGALVLGYAASTSVVLSFPGERLPAWYVPSNPAMVLSPAGWWHVGFTLPLLLALVFRWLWRIAVWDTLLWRISHCELRLMGSHPDRMAGLGFVGGSVRAFVPFAVALSTLAASRTAQLIVEGQTLSTSRMGFDVVYLVIVGLLIVAPLLVFTPRLMLTRRMASAAYGILGLRVGRVFERTWIAPGREVNDETIHVQDFSATTDLYAIVENARHVQAIPLRRRDLFALAAALAIPFLPVVLLKVPVSAILPQLKGLLF